MNLLPPHIPAATRDIVQSVFDVAEGIEAAFPREEYLRRARARGHSHELYQAIADAGLLAIGIDEELGGSGGGLTGCTAVMESLSARGIPPLQYSVTVFTRESLLKHGSQAQIDEFVIPTMEGKRRICIGVTEPDAGTNAFATRTTAYRDVAGGYVINGQKVFISGADDADFILLLARSAPPGEPVGRRSGLSLFIVDLQAPGIDLRPLDIDWHAPERQFEVFFDNVRVDEADRIGEEGLGFDHLLSTLNQERVIVAAWAIGIGQYALDKAVRYAKERAPFGTPIGAHQGVQHPLALAKAELEAARLTTYAAAAAYDAGEDAGDLANMAKLLGSRAALAAVEAAIQTHGGSAFVYETDIVTLWPMVRVLQIAPLNNQSILNYIGTQVLGLPRS